MQAFTVYAVCTVHTLFYGFGIDGLGEAVADYTSYTVFHGFVAQRLGFGFGQSENNEKPYIRYKRYKPFKASTVYAVIWFFTAWGSTAWGKLLPTIRLYPLYTVFYCLGSTAWGSFCRRYGFVWCAVLTVLRLRGWDLNLGRPKNGEKPYKRYTPSTISTSVYGLARRARKDRRARPCNFLALLALLA